MSSWLGVLVSRVKRDSTRIGRISMNGKGNERKRRKRKRKQNSKYQKFQVQINCGHLVQLAKTKQRKSSVHLSNYQHQPVTLMERRFRPYEMMDRSPPLKSSWSH